jgi:hypothetical protein
MKNKLRRPIDIEPLSDARWGRVERAVLDAALAPPASDPLAMPAEAGPRSRTISFAGSRPIASFAGSRPIASFAGSRPIASFAGSRPTAAALVLAGALATIAGAVAFRSLVPEGARAETTRVETAANGSRVEFGESTIDVGPTSAVRLAGDDSRGVVVTLDRGLVECDVSPRNRRPPFLVEAGSVEVRVVGTHFAVVRAGDAVSVDVQRGEVEVIFDGKASQVAAGEHWPSARPSTASPPAPEPANETAPREPETSSETGTVAPMHEPRGAAEPHLGKTPRERYDDASRLEAMQPDAALSIYRGLAREGGAWGENALFAAGRLEANRGDRDEARRLLRDYLTRYPSGPNADDARQLLDRLR